MKTITVRTFYNDPTHRDEHSASIADYWTFEIWDGKNLLGSGQAMSNALAQYAAGVVTSDLVRAGKLRVGMFKVKTDFDTPF